LNYLIDTNVISETRRKKADEGVMEFIHSQPSAALFISVLTIGELKKGVDIATRLNPAEAIILNQWFSWVKSTYQDRFIEINHEVAEIWGQLSAIRTLPMVDGFLAATAIAQNMTLVTRNVRDFTGLNISLLNPWKSTN
jgi:predicted nucleic acid-binding protein